MFLHRITLLRPPPKDQVQPTWVTLWTWSSTLLLDHVFHARIHKVFMHIWNCAARQNHVFQHLGRRRRRRVMNQTRVGPVQHQHLYPNAHTVLSHTFPHTTECRDSSLTGTLLFILTYFFCLDFPRRESHVSISSQPSKHTPKMTLLVVISKLANFSN